MAAPTVTTRGTPTGIKLKNGYPTKIAFALLPAFNMWEIAVTPLGYKGGDKIDTTTMLNTAVTTADTQDLLETTDPDGECMYDPIALDEVQNTLLNKNGAVTVHHPDGSKDSFYGALTEFLPTRNERGKRPTANFKVSSTNYDPVNHLEVKPIRTLVAGT